MVVCQTAVEIRHFVNPTYPCHRWFVQRARAWNCFRINLIPRAVPHRLCHARRRSATKSTYHCTHTTYASRPWPKTNQQGNAGMLARRRTGSQYVGAGLPAAPDTEQPNSHPDRYTTALTKQLDPRSLVYVKLQQEGYNPDSVLITTTRHRSPMFRPHA